MSRGDNNSLNPDCITPFTATIEDVNRRYCIEHEWLSVQHYMQAYKAAYFDDSNAFWRIRDCKTVQDIVSLGRRVKKFDPRKWNAIRFKVAIRASEAKFASSSGLRSTVRRFRFQSIVSHLLVIV